MHTWVCSCCGLSIAVPFAGVVLGNTEFPAMDQQWRRFHLLLVFLTLWKHATGYPSLNSQVNPRSSRYHKAFSPRGFKSLSDASTTKNFPLDVHSNVLAVKSPSSSLFSQGGMSSQSHSQGSGASQVLGASSLHAPGSPAHAKLLSSSGRFTSQVTSRQGSPSHFTSTSQDSSSSKFTASSSQFVSAQGGSTSLSGLSSQSRSTSSQYRPVSSAYPSLGSLSMTVSAPSSVKTSQFALSSGSRGGSSQLATSRLSGLAQGVSSHPVGSHVQSQGSPSQLAFGSPQYASASMAAAQTTSNQYNQASAQSLSQKQTSRRLQPSVSSSSQGSPSSGAAWPQSRFSVLSSPAPSKSLASGQLSQSAPASLYSSASMPLPQSGSSLYSQAAGSALSLSQSQAPQKWQKAASLSSQGFQTSSTAVSQNGTPSQGAKFPSRFSLASGSVSSQPVSTQGAGSYGGLAQSPSSSAHAPAYSKPASSPLGVPSQLTSGQSLYASSSQSTTGGTLGASSRYASAQREVGSNIASLQPQVAAGQYAPAPSLDVKVPVYTHATSSGSSMSSSLQSQTWQPTTSRRVYSSFPTSGAGLTQTSFSPQSVQSSSRFSSVAGGTSRLLTQSRGSYTGSSQSLGSVGQYTPGSPAYAKFGASSLGISSQSTSGQSSSSQHSPLSSTEAGGQPTFSSGYLSAQGESSSSVGSSLLSQGALAKEVLAPMDTSMSFASQTAAVSSGTQVSDAAFQSGSSQASSSLSSLQALSSPVDSVPQSASVSSQVSPFGHPSGSMTPSSGSSVHAASEGVSSASSQAQALSESAGSGASVGSQRLSGGSTSVLSGSYDSSFGQSAPVSTPSLGSLSRYYGVKG